MVWLLLVLGLVLVVVAGFRVVNFYRRPADQRQAADWVGVALAMSGVALISASSAFD